jgi:hypothetical protein
VISEELALATKAKTIAIAEMQRYMKQPSEVGKCLTSSTTIVDLKGGVVKGVLAPR